MMRTKIFVLDIKEMSKSFESKYACIFEQASLQLSGASEPPTILSRNSSLKD